MDLKQLETLTKDPSVHSEILGTFTGAYMIGISRAPGAGESAELTVHVEGTGPPNFPGQIRRFGETIRVVVKPGYVPVVPLTT